MYDILYYSKSNHLDAKARGLHLHYHDHSLHHGGKPGPYSDDHESHHSDSTHDHEHSLHHGGRPGPYPDDHKSHHLESAFNYENNFWIPGPFADPTMNPMYPTI